MERKGWPEVDEFVVCTVKKVMDFGVFVELDEYGKKEGLIHISEVASGWVKYIRDHVREGQKIVCKALNVVPEKLHIDLSLKDVNEHQRREKIREWKNEQKAEKWIDYVTELAKLTPEQHETLIKTLYDAFDTVYASFEDVRANGTSALITEGIDETVANFMAKLANENLKIPSVDISGFVDITCSALDGVEVIKKSLLAGKKVKTEDATIDISYVGAPRYRIHIIAPDYKIAESMLKKSSEHILKSVQKAGGTATFHRNK
ncbi:MAG: translation initiation factor IF-2 subunit alpha [Methanosarcinales archaeon]|uniref:Translation initiation factor 2 subunit alpha n=1 Tax=Candidatus Ethanoperedens thermophilum TaxID=2766897 RepID=A0A848DA17_9EURY|nr:translation initiation factor IF-2 subunit alpha [Candidatus Ethanoperedens thermophilum]